MRLLDISLVVSALCVHVPWRYHAISNTCRLTMSLVTIFLVKASDDTCTEEGSCVAVQNDETANDESGYYENEVEFDDEDETLSDSDSDDL